MRVTTIIAGLATTLWLALFLLGIGVINDIAAQHAADYPNWSQIAVWAVFPAFVATALACSIYFFSRVYRSAAGLGALSALSLVMVLPFILTFAGGV